MNRYRTAFFLTLATTVLLAAALLFLWLKPHLSSVQALTAALPQTADSPATEPALAPVALTPERMQSVGVKTGVVEYKQVHDEIQTTGNVEVDETRVAEEQVRFTGWIQQVYADATFKQVRKGQPLLTIYSPELVSTENEYLLARQNRDLLAK